MLLDATWAKRDVARGHPWLLSGTHRRIWLPELEMLETMAVWRALCCALSVLEWWQQQRTCASVSAACGCSLAASSGTAIGRCEPGGCRNSSYNHLLPQLRYFAPCLSHWVIIPNNDNNNNGEINNKNIIIRREGDDINTKGELLGCPCPWGQFLLKRSSLCWSFPVSLPCGFSLTITSRPSVSYLPSGHGVCCSRLVLILVIEDQVMHLLLPLGPKIQWILHYYSVCSVSNVFILLQTFFTDSGVRSLPDIVCSLNM